MAEKALMELKATNGTLLVYNDRVVIKRKGLFAVASQGIKGDTVFFYNTLSGVDYKRPGMINGYMRFVTGGTVDFNSKSGLIKTSKATTQDPNTVVLRAFKSSTPKMADEIYNLILQKINEAHSNAGTVVNQLSGADEIVKYKNLLDQGIITQEEFDKKKSELLNI